MRTDLEGPPLPNLPDYQAWRDANHKKEFSLTDYIYGIWRQHKLHPDFFVGLIELMWPKFVEVDNRIFLKQTFSPARCEQLRADLNSDEEIEYWMNLTVLDALFESSTEDFYSEHAEYVLSSMAEMWTWRLREMFPNKKFIVSVIKDFERGDFGITFSQAR
ncbi:MAG: hypothetical protein JWQ23_948 [Herminiimonas sp.]|nr:hypothetical protein [Herminiimonas sp.]